MPRSKSMILLLSLFLNNDDDDDDDDDDLWSHAVHGWHSWSFSASRVS